MKQLTISSWCLVFPTIQQKIEFQDVLLNKLKVVHESANAMTKTLLLKSCSWYFQNCSGYFCCCCMSLLKTENENSLKSNVTLLRDAAAYLQVPWPFSILSLWKNKEELCNTSITDLLKTTIKRIHHSNLLCRRGSSQRHDKRETPSQHHKQLEAQEGATGNARCTRLERHTWFQLLLLPTIGNYSWALFCSQPDCLGFPGLLFPAWPCSCFPLP